MIEFLNDYWFLVGESIVAFWILGHICIILFEGKYYLKGTKRVLIPFCLLLWGFMAPFVYAWEGLKTLAQKTRRGVGWLLEPKA